MKLPPTPRVLFLRELVGEIAAQLRSRPHDRRGRRSTARARPRSPTTSPPCSGRPGTTRSAPPSATSTGRAPNGPASARRRPERYYRDALRLRHVAAGAHRPVPDGGEHRLPDGGLRRRRDAPILSRWMTGAAGRDADHRRRVPAAARAARAAGTTRSVELRATSPRRTPVYVARRRPAAVGDALCRRRATRSVRAGSSPTAAETAHPSGSPTLPSGA